MTPVIATLSLAEHVDAALGREAAAYSAALILLSAAACMGMPFAAAAAAAAPRMRRLFLHGGTWRTAAGMQRQQPQRQAGARQRSLGRHPNNA